jgi:hypothetical protein
MLAALVVADQRQPRLIQLWRTRVIEPRVCRIAEVCGLPLETARLLGDLAFGGIVARYIARGEVTEQDADEIASVLADHPLFRDVVQVDATPSLSAPSTLGEPFS